MDISTFDLSKSFTDAGEEYVVLKGITSTFHKGSLTCIIGNSGSGKTTFFNILSSLIEPNMGSVLFDNTELGAPNRNFRKENIGYLGQYPENNLFLDLSVQDNFSIVFSNYRIQRSKRKDIMRRELAAVNLDKIPVDSKCKLLSGGELQRLSLVLSILHDPPVIIADEPTGNLDLANAHELLRLLKKLSTDKSKTVLIASHDELVQQYADVTIRLTDGRISSIYRGGKVSNQSGRGIPILVGKGGTVTIPESLFEKLPMKKIVYANIKDNRLILNFGEEDDE